MADNKARNLVILVLLVVITFLFRPAADMFTGHSTEEIRKRMKKHLREKYGKKFVVERIGTRSFGDTEYYQARVYPKSILGTNKEGDEYYYADAKIDKLSFGRLREPGDTYGRVKVRKKAEDYLMSKVKEIFGEKVKIKPKITYYTRNDHGTMVGYLTPNFRKALGKSIKDPDNNRLELELDVYIFDRIEDRQEKEKRRKQIFEFMQYLKEEELYEYLELGVTFIDERVLAPSYDDFKSEIRLCDKVKKERNGEEVKMPPMELRNEMSRKLQKEINEMSKEEILNSMEEIKKDELTYDNMREYHGQYYCWIYSIGMLEENYRSSITEEDRKTKHDKLEDIELSKYKKYIYIN